MGSRLEIKNRIVLVAFPFDDLSTTKVRPALCLTEPLGLHQLVVMAFITSSVSSFPLATDFVFDPSEPDFSITGLRFASTLQLHRLMTVSKGMIRRELGRVTPRHEAEIARRLKQLFDLR